MDNEDLLARVQHRGRLHGRNESRRAVRAVVEALGEFLSPRAFHLLAEQLPEPVRHHPAPAVTRPTSRAFLAGIAQRLHLDGPDAAFTARIVLEELNATGRVITPARFVHLVAADLRPLLGARRAPVLADESNPAPRRVIRVRPAPAPIVRPAPAPVPPAQSFNTITAAGQRSAASWTAGRESSGGASSRSTTTASSNR